MKYPIAILLMFLTMGLMAQKQIQPYHYTRTNDDGKTTTILIYATASSANNVKFTLKDDKNVPLNIEGKEPFEFEVFPFMEVNFRNKLIEQFDRLKTLKEDAKDNEYLLFSKLADDLKKVAEDNAESLKARRRAVQDIRNIYQFFNALITTAFQYDDEPIAGKLSYAKDLIITKKSIDGFDTDIYFEKQAKYLRYNILRSRTKPKYIDKKQRLKNRTNEKLLEKHENSYWGINIDGEFCFNTSNYRGLDPDPFMRWLREKESIIGKFYSFHQNALKGTGWLRGKSRHKFKVHAREELPKLYNEYETEDLLNKGIIMPYVEFFYKRDGLKDRIEKNKELISEKEKDHKRIGNVNLLIDEKKKEISNLGKGLFSINNFYGANFYRGKKPTTTSFLDSTNLAKSRPIDSEKLEILFKEIVNHYIELDNNKHGDVALQKEIELLKDKNQNLKDEIKYVNDRIGEFISSKRNLFRRFPLWRFKVDKIEMDINDGFIEHITVVGTILKPLVHSYTLKEYFKKVPLQDMTKKDILYKIKISKITVDDIINGFYEEPTVKEILKESMGKKLKFENEYPIGFSYKTDYADLHAYNLYHFERFDKTYSLNLGDVIQYYQKHANDRLDFSPKDQVVTLPENDPGEVGFVELKKETSSKILSARFYSDFIGFQEADPNGLFQIEVEKFLPIWTKRHHLGLGRNSNFGITNYANFDLTWAKVGDKERDLQVTFEDQFVNNENIPNRFASYLDLIRYENLSVGVDLNLFSFELPIAKIRAEINGGIHYGRTHVIDTISESKKFPLKNFNKDVNTIRFYPDFILRIRPDERFGGFLRFRPYRLVVPKIDEFFSVSNANSFIEDNDLSKRWLHRYELSTHFEPSKRSDNKFFFRYRYTNDADYSTNGFSEIQVGYLAYLKF